MKKEEGITLITEVIIIVFLFIIVGIGISLVVRNNGVLTQTRIAVASDEETRAKEEIRSAYVSTQYEYWIEWEMDPSINKEEFFMENDRLEENIKKVVDKNVEIKVTKNENEFYVSYKFTDSNEKFNFKIDSNGNVFGVTDYSINIKS